MTNPRSKQEKAALHSINVAKTCAFFTEDLIRSIIGFIPNGLNLLYDFALKRIPGIGHFFAHRWVEQVLKLCTGITIGQGLAGDLAYYVGRPLGQAIGILLGSSFKAVPQYQGQIGKVLYRLSAQTVGGALFAILAFIVMAKLLNLQDSISLNSVLLAMTFGALLGLSVKAALIFAINSVNKANAAAARKHFQRAKELNGVLKSAAKLKAKSIILRQAQDIIQQMNGPQSQPYLESFFEAKHINYTNYDIEISEVGKQKFYALNPKGVPLIFVGEQRIDGFNKPALEKALKDNGLLKQQF